MALFRGYFSASAREQRAVMRAITELSREQMPAQAEVEGGASFLTQVSLHRSVLVVARPRRLQGGLAQGAFVRLTLPNRHRMQVRMPVLVPRARLRLSHRYACLCQLPTEFSGQCRREGDRLDTRRYANLSLDVREQARRFRMLDISASGLRIYTGEDDDLMMFVRGMVVSGAQLAVGQNTTIGLDTVLPRSRGDGWVGMEMHVAEDGQSGGFLARLLERLRQAELRRLTYRPAT